MAPVFNIGGYTLPTNWSLGEKYSDDWSKSDDELVTYGSYPEYVQMKRVRLIIMYYLILVNNLIILI